MQKPAIIKLMIEIILGITSKMVNNTISDIIKLHLSDERLVFFIRLFRSSNLLM